MHLRGALLGLTLVVGCYDSPKADPTCSITCDVSASDACPSGLTCDNGFCVGSGQVCKPEFSHTTVGTGFACALDAAGAVWCWGDNQTRVIAANNNTHYNQATRVDATRQWTALDAGGGHVCGIAGGQLYCWGQNDHTQVSQNDAQMIVGAPLLIDLPSGVSSWLAVSAGHTATCAIAQNTDGVTHSLWCWGDGFDDELGDAMATDSGLPVQVGSGIANDWTSVDIGYGHACAVSPSEGVFCWGDNSYAESAVAGTQTAMPVLALSLTDLPNPVQVAVSEYATCAVGDHAYCWGDNGYDELGANRIGMAGSFDPGLVDDQTGWTAVTASSVGFCGVRGGQVVCWGTTNAGALGQGTWNQSGFGVVAGTTGATEVSMGWDGDNGLEANACATIAGEAWCWGDNRWGQLGQATQTLEPQPRITAGATVFTDLRLGVDHACGLDKTGTMWCWGSTELGQASGKYAGSLMPLVPCSPSPTLECDVGAPEQMMFFTMTTEIALGAYHTCAMHSGATGNVISCWGDDSYQQLLTGNGPRERDIPPPAAATWQHLIETPGRGQCALANQTTVKAECWGLVAGMQYGSSTAVGAAPDFDTAVSLALGYTSDHNTAYACVLDQAHGVKCDGDDTEYSYGDDLTVSPGALTDVPTQDGLYSDLESDYSSGSMCGIVATDGSIACWGADIAGVTGLAPVTGTYTTTPNPIAGLSGCTSLAVGGAHACAVCNGDLSCWGDNSVGQLGIGMLDTLPSTTTPMMVPPPANETWSSVVASVRFTCGLAVSGHAYCWGFNPHGALGNDARSANYPVVVKNVPVPAT
jgi:alpha-tubulin suppressor-like RCC1 family protein